MTSHASDANQRAWTRVMAMHRRVEGATKTVEAIYDAFPEPVANELRMTLYHVLCALEKDNSHEEWDKALSHCQRAYYDAREIEVISLLKIISDFERDCAGHEDVVKANISGYADKRKANLAAQKAVKEPALNGDERERHYEKYDTFRETLMAHCDEITAMRPAIETAVRKQKIKFFFQCVAALGALATLVGLIAGFVF